MAAPTTQLPPGYTWGQRGTGDHVTARQWVIKDPTGAVAGRDPNAIWDSYEKATGTGAGSGIAPGTQLTLRQISNIGTADQYQKGADEKLLGDLETEYGGIDDVLRKNYMDAAKRAGTYGNTAEFSSGLDSEVKAGSRGARTALAARINALRKSLGMPEFAPQEDATPQGEDGPEPATNKAVNAEKGTDNGTAETGALDTSVPQTPDNLNAVSGVQSGLPATFGKIDPKRLASLQKFSTSFGAF